MKKTAQEIIDHLDKIDDIKGELAYDFNGKEVSKIKLGKIKLVHEEGGNEGEGEDMSKVFYFEEHDVYLRMDGFYSSFGGSEWYELYHVEPKEVMVIQYESVKK